MSSSFIAVIDIGKTNKKVIIFDSNLKIVDSAYGSFEEYVEDGVHYEQIGPMFAWVKQQLTVFAKKFPIKAISVTAHGATAMCIDNEGKLAIPPVAYTTDAGEEFRKEFYDIFGDPKSLQSQTATAEIGNMINVGKKLYFMKKHWPDKFENVKVVLNFPQYIGYLFTGKIGAEPTYVGCHTYLYDFENRTYSSVARSLGIENKLPPQISKSWEILGTVQPEIAKETGLSTDCIVTMGIHDSNSSLLPYLVKGYGDFVLNSTGTWCVAMHPTDRVSFNNEELGKLVFFNMDAFFNPVKTSIFMGGLEFETYRKLLCKICGRDDFPAYNQELYSKLLNDKSKFILPSVVKGTGLFPDALPRVIEGEKQYPLAEIESGKNIPEFFNDYETAFATLVISLTIQTKIALSMTGYDGAGSIFTEGGFRKNKAYNALLSAMHPRSKVYLTKLEEATAFGAALLAKAAIENVTPREINSCFEIEKLPVESAPFEGLEKYIADFELKMRT